VYIRIWFIILAMGRVLK